MTISFVGHSFIPQIDRIKDMVKEQIRTLIAKESSATCYLGGHGDFDELCACACRELKRERIDIELVYVTPYMSVSEQKKIKEMQRCGLYDASVYPPLENTPKRAAILKRNEWMMTNADIIIAYVNCGCGGAYRALRVAERRNKSIVNICDFI